MFGRKQHDDRFSTNYSAAGSLQLDAGNKILVQNLHYNVVEKDLIVPHYFFSFLSETGRAVVLIPIDRTSFPR